MMNGEGKVYGVEHMKSLVELSLTNIKKSHGELLHNGSVGIIEADGRNGLAKYAPYNCIHVGAGKFNVFHVNVNANY